jgi:hypothetical protein
LYAGFLEKTQGKLGASGATGGGIGILVAAVPDKRSGRRHRQCDGAHDFKIGIWQV